MATTVITTIVMATTVMARHEAICSINSTRFAVHQTGYLDALFPETVCYVSRRYAKEMG